MFFRGDVPCDILFVGEAPGESENMLGEPFTGAAGTWINKIIDEVLVDRTVGLTNVLSCIPWDNGDSLEELAKGVRPPTKEEAYACRPRLLEIIRLCKPKLIFTLGKETASVFPKQRDGLPVTIPVIQLIHPAALARYYNKDRFRFNEEYPRCVMKVHRAVEEHLT